MNIKNGLKMLLPAAILLAVGVYIISNTCLITKDGPYYIEQAQKFAANPIAVIKHHYFGYPFLIYITHKAASVFGATDSPASWAISAQSITLACMLAAFVPLYLIGKSFIGKNKTLCALLILSVLPYPVRFGCDIIRDWPYILFLIGGIAAVVLASSGKKWCPWGLAGILAALGSFIKPEAGQIIIYALLWLSFCIISPRYQMTRKKAVLSALLLLVCFTAVLLPYLYVKQQFVPEKIEEMMNSSQSQSQPQETAMFTATLTGRPAASAVKVFERTGENLFYYFFVLALIGFYQRFIKDFRKISDLERVLVISFFLFNFIMLVWLYSSSGYLSRRHCLPMSLLFLFYCPGGMEIVSQNLSGVLKQKAGLLFSVLLVAGIVLCLPALLAVKRNDRAGLLEAANWLNSNTPKESLIAVGDLRISFYAQREGFYAWERKDFGNADFAVVEVESDVNSPDWGEKTTEFWVNPQKKKSRLIIYKLSVE
jgi:hypothetical protein